jgi:hypothetical protein
MFDLPPKNGTMQSAENRNARSVFTLCIGTDSITGEFLKSYILLDFPTAVGRNNCVALISCYVRTLFRGAITSAGAILGSNQKSSVAGKSNPTARPFSRAFRLQLDWVPAFCRFASLAFKIDPLAVSPAVIANAGGFWVCWPHSSYVFHG